jgi:tetratricopeptide (TPR) repeat protein
VGADPRQEHFSALNPSEADMTAVLALVLEFSGRPKESIGLIKKAMRLSPVYSPWYLWILGISLRLMGRYEEALVTYERLRDLIPDSPWPYLQLGVFGERRLGADA